MSDLKRNYTMPPPIKKKYRRAAKKKSTNIPLTIVRMGRQPFPRRLYNTLRYTEIVPVTITAGVGGNYVFSCNSLNDPNRTGGGHQPLYYDTLTSVYDHYVVLSSYIKLTPFALTSVTGCLSTVLYVDDDTTASLDWKTNAERVGSKMMSYSPGASSPAPLTMSWSAKDAFGGDVEANTRLQGTNTNNPSEEQFFFITPADGTGGSYTANFIVELWYDVAWKELSTITGS